MAARAEWRHEHQHQHQRAALSLSLSPRARLCLFHGTSVSADAALALSDDEITLERLLRSGSGAGNVLAAGLGPVDLRERGVETADDLCALGFDAISLCDAPFAHQAALAYGAEAVKRAFLVTPRDAVALASGEAMHLLNAGAEELLGACAGAPREAACVLSRLALGGGLQGVPTTTVLDAGLRHQTLRACGYGAAQLVAQCGATASQLATLGFAVG